MSFSCVFDHFEAPADSGTLHVGLACASSVALRRVKTGDDLGERLRLVVLPGYSLLCWAYVSEVKAKG